MNMQIPTGVWPTMVTPFTEDNKIDYEALERLIEWYIDKGVAGLFAVCQSSEMFYLSLEERVELAAFVKKKAAGRVPVIASGHISESYEQQVEELQAIAAAGVDALVLITNRLAREEESDDVLLSNLKRLLLELPVEVPLGFYECPYPYKRLLSPALLKWCAESGRFLFLKDTSCDIVNIGEKLKAAEGTGLNLYNANTATLLETMKLGVTGYSGVMANFHPELYVKLLRDGLAQPDMGERLVDFLSIASLIEKQLYPVNAKYYLMLEGIFTNYRSRSKNQDEFTSTNRLEVEQLHHLTAAYVKNYAN